jgi:stage III sporulation protein AH
MLLKKQTVWLLTMLSLIIVLSVYYITSPTQSPTDLAAYQDDETDKTAADTSKDDTTGASVSSVSSDDAFVALRMQIENERSKMGEDLTDIMANSNVSEEVKLEAFDKYEALSELAMKERTLETLIAAMGYQDVLVNTMEDVVEVIVKTEKELTKKQANEIMLKTMEELGENKQVSVKYYTMNN